MCEWPFLKVNLLFQFDCVHVHVHVRWELNSISYSILQVYLWTLDIQHNRLTALLDIYISMAHFYFHYFLPFLSHIWAWKGKLEESSSFKPGICILLLPLPWPEKVNWKQWFSRAIWAVKDVRSWEWKAWHCRHKEQLRQSDRK